MADLNTTMLTASEQQMLAYLPHLFGGAGGGFAFLFILWRFKLLRKFLIGLQAFLAKVTDDDSNTQHQKTEIDTRPDIESNFLTITASQDEIRELFKEVRNDQGLLDNLKDDIGKNKTRIKIVESKIDLLESEIKEFRGIISTLQILLGKMETAIGFIKDGK